MLNNVNLCGRLVENPELKKTTNGTSVTAFTIAVDRDYTSGDEKQTDFIKIVAWRGTAEFVSKYFTKGKLIIINGAIQVRKYVNQDGENRYITEVIANHVYFAGDKSEKPNVNVNDELPTYASDNRYVEEIEDMEDMPF
jgi:single-strand DNA-binding protein